eukprot:CAMPEP_0170520834 /NCGR_PEP_ID=MMETSP0209-20121228/6164_1 /TAXON_ID=665100 ORGANISM="Litonotus pictus, Strain P1" /NCGR_SAMPLE_ID=MMETSP0209 /ASSEMBLY_ACC=CAM_ASM_000301 /LENGTH=310 /DNA_ID=CAMNT_0010807393 /DNA_START=98 /DNA_END=1030 /DNA_ORIENTATION=+
MKKKQLLEYKGIHYKKEKQIRYYEHGAHFKYVELYDILNGLIKQEAETNCETANFSVTNNSNAKLTHVEKVEEEDLTGINKASNEGKNKSNNQLKEIGNITGKSKIYTLNKSNKDFSKHSVIGAIGHNSENTLRNASNYNVIKPNYNKDFTHIQSQYSQAKIGANLNKDKDRKSIVLPPINQKLENLEIVPAKIDTGLKGAQSHKKDMMEINKIHKLIESNQIQIDNPNSEKAKKFKAFNQNVANIFKGGQHNTITHNKEKIKSLQEIKSNLPNYRSVNPNSLNSMLNNMTKMSNTKDFNMKALHMPGLK